jgi:hypothetical protein
MEVKRMMIGRSVSGVVTSISGSSRLSKQILFEITGSLNLKK